jgi:hypothetical protein
MLHQLRSSINEENSKKTEKIKVNKDLIASQEQMLEQLIKTGKPQNMQNGLIAMIKDLRLEAETL